MRTIRQRLQKLEKTFVPAAPVETEWDEWDSMAGIRDKLLELAKPRGELAVAQLRTELDELGPSGLWCETVRCHLRKHGFVQRDKESWAELVMRARGISAQELKVYFAQNRIGRALLDRFTESRIATDI